MGRNMDKDVYKALNLLQVVSAKWGQSRASGDYDESETERAQIEEIKQRIMSCVRGQEEYAEAQDQRIAELKQDNERLQSQLNATTRALTKGRYLDAGIIEEMPDVTLAEVMWQLDGEE